VRIDALNGSGCFTTGFEVLCLCISVFFTLNDIFSMLSVWGFAQDSYQLVSKCLKLFLEFFGPQHPI